MIFSRIVNIISIILLCSRNNYKILIFEPFLPQSVKADVDHR